MILGPINSGAAAGGAGVATNNAVSSHSVKGFVEAVYIKYNGSPPNTTDVTIATQGTSARPPANTILTVSNANTDGWFYPRHTVHDETGTAITYNGTREVHEKVPVDDYIKVTIAQANNDDTVDVWLLISPPNQEF